MTDRKEGNQPQQMYGHKITLGNLNAEVYKVYEDPTQKGFWIVEWYIPGSGLQKSGFGLQALKTVKVEVGTDDPLKIFLKPILDPNNLEGKIR